ncbi:MAG: sigma-E processing peptidase SpoIIGA [Clostridiales bacterium]|nr:sigma-E processing peptidase SpoIIGA [Clostridiales bacterium]
MQVYVELALLENFCMDFTLLYCAKLVSKNGAGWRRISISSALGACFAVLFPLLPLPAVVGIIIKIVSGLILCLVAGKCKSVKGYIKLTAAFFVFSAVLAGALIGIFSLAGIAYAEGGGYILSSVPIGIPMFGALLLFIAARVIKNKYSKGSKKEVNCRIYAGKSSVSIAGFFDSGNKVSYRGSPVSVIPKKSAEKIIDVEGITEGVKIHTVAGSKIIKVFTADRLEVDFGDKTEIYKGVKIGVSHAHIACAVLHPDILEE